MILLWWQLIRAVAQKILLNDEFKHIYPDKFTYSDNRAILFGANDDQSEQELRHIISIALTYHLN